MYYEEPANVESWSPELRRSANSSKWIRALIGWQSILGNTGLSPVGLAGVTGISPRRLVSSIKKYSNRYPGRVSLSYCSTTKLPIFSLSLHYDYMDWSNFGDDWDEVAVDLLDPLLKKARGLSREEMASFDPYDTGDAYINPSEYKYLCKISEAPTKDFSFERSPSLW